MASDRKDQRTRIKPSTLGILEPSMDPLRTIGMEVAFYRGIASPHYRHPMLRVVSILFGIILTIQSALIFIVASNDTTTINIFTGIVAAFIGIVILLLGIKIIYANLKHRNPAR